MGGLNDVRPGSIKQVPVLHKAWLFVKSGVGHPGRSLPSPLPLVHPRPALVHTCRPNQATVSPLLSHAMTPDEPERLVCPRPSPPFPSGVFWCRRSVQGAFLCSAWWPPWCSQPED